MSGLLCPFKRKSKRPNKTKQNFEDTFKRRKKSLKELIKLWQSHVKKEEKDRFERIYSPSLTRRKMVKKLQKNKEEKDKRTKKMQVKFRNKGINFEMRKMRESNYRIRKRANTKKMNNIKRKCKKDKRIRMNMVS